MPLTISETMRLVRRDRHAGAVQVAAPADETLARREQQAAAVAPGMLPIDSIGPHPCQPRRCFDDADMAQLADSLRQHDVLQPIVVRAVDGGYELIAGERRRRAARLAGFTEIPAIVREATNEEALVLALIENLHRKDLNPVEKAGGYQVLHEGGMSHEAIGEKFGEERRTVSYAIQLLELEKETLALIESGALGAAHGKALLGVSDAAVQTELARTAAEKGWHVRRLQAQIERLNAHRPAGANSDTPGVRELQHLLAQALGVKVTVHLGRERERRAGRTHDKLQRATAWVRMAMETVT